MKYRYGILILVAFLWTLPGSGQVTTAQATDAIENARIHADFAASAGAKRYAPTLIEDAMTRLDMAREELADDDESAAYRSAVESAEASIAAEAKSKWLSTAAEIRTLRSDLDRLGAALEPISLVDEPAIVLPSAENSRERVKQARELMNEAKALRPTGAEGAELERADALLGSAEKIVNQAKNNETANHLAYVASMMARQAIYLTRLRELAGVLPELRLRRTELAQAEAARQAEQARLQRESAERELERMRQRLEQEQSQRAAEQAEITRLRDNLRKQQEVLVAELSGSRVARIEAERRLDTLRAEYETSLRSKASDSTEIEKLRQRVEDQELRLSEIRRGEQQSEAALLREIEALRKDLREQRELGRIPEEELRRQEQELRQRESQIEKLRRERTDEMEARQKAQEDFQTRVVAAERQMRETMREREELESRLSEERQAREQAERELERTRAQLAEREKLENERRSELESMKAQLAELAETRSDERGFIVTLPGLFFDTGKATLKAGTKANLAKIAGLLDQMDRVRIIVEGHTDSVGAEQMNQRLSESRAGAVHDYLVEQGVEAAAITTVGRGESQPIATNDTAEGRSKNRRVEIVIEELD